MRARTGLVIRLVSAVVVGGLLVAGAGALLAPRGGDRPSREPRLAAQTPVEATSAVIRRAQERLARTPGDWATWAELGLTYVEQARLTADPSFYDKAEGALRRSLSEHPKDNSLATTGLGALAAARHDFPAALRHAEAAVAAAPFSGPGYGVLADACIELGRYDEGFTAVQKMVDLRPGTASYARASYTFELRGDVPAAQQALEDALEAAPAAADAAFALYYLGELAWNAGDLATASTRYDEGLKRRQDDVPLLVGRAKVRAARGDTAGALADYRTATTRMPSPTFLAEYGDLLTATGDRAGADQQYGLVRVQQKILSASGVNTDLELALFDADHGAPEAALVAARAAYAERKSVFAADALAWALYRNKRHAEALPYAREAVRLGTRSALLRYHLGAIEAAVGQRGPAAKDLELAVKINPHFSVRHAPDAKALLATARSAA